MPEAIGAAATKIVLLPCGLGPDKDGKIYRDAEIAPMTGLVRKNIARPEIRQSPVRVLDTILLACLKRIGPFDRTDRRTLDKLLMGDKDFLLLEIRKLSFSSSILTSTATCGECKEKVDLKIDIDKLPTIPMPENTPIENGERVFTVEFEHGGTANSAKFRFPNGTDQAAVAQVIFKNPVEGQYLLWQRCLVEWEGQPIEKVSPTLFDDLPLPVIDAVDDKFRATVPGPNMRQSVVCPLCGASNRLDLGATDFLFPQARERTSPE